MKKSTIFTLLILVLLMGIISFFKSQKDAKTNTPWGEYPSIYSHINDNLNLSGALNDVGEKLPDDERRFKPGELRWVSGGMDGAFGHHGGTNNNEKISKQVAELVNSISRKNELSDKIDLYNLLLDDSLMDFIDLALEKIVELKPPIDPFLHNYAKWLVTKSPDRGPVKFGIAILGLISEESDLEFITLMGKHEEFTLFSAVAVTNILEKPDNILWEMAKSVDGWGRIHLVERLANTDRSEIKNWLVTEGYKNSVMYEYLAYTCAVSGDLHLILSKPIINIDMLNSAGEIIDALIAGGPAESIDDYEHAASVISDYLRHIEHNAMTLDQFIIAYDIKEFLSGSEEEWSKREKGAWEKHDRHALEKKAEKIVNKPEWRQLVLDNLNTADEAVFWKVNRSADILKIDIWETHWKRLTDSPLDSGRWYNIMSHVNASRIDDVLNFAKQALPLDKIASGPGKELGIGKEFNAHSCLDFILQVLGQYPGKGVNLIKVGLRSPVVRNRNMSIKALSKWGQENWPDGIVPFLEEMKLVEPEDDVKKSIETLLKGESLA
jgi:hypothetical protein